jgi:glutamate/aspartate transport system substrate-binding protein
VASWARCRHGNEQLKGPPKYWWKPDSSTERLKMKTFSSLSRVLLGAAWALLAGAAGDVSAQPLSSNTLKKIQASGVVVLGHRVGSVPFSYLDANLQPIGYSVDLCHAVVAAIKAQLKLPDLKVKMVAVTSATRIPMVANGSVDLECGITTNTQERQKRVAFSVTTFVAQSRLLAKKANNIRQLADLRGRPVVSTVSTTSIARLNEINAQQQLGMRILAGKDDPDSFLFVQSDRAVAFAMDDVLLYALIARSSRPQDYSVSDEALSVEPYGIMLGKDDPEFKRLVDGALMALFRSGDIQRLYHHWFESPVPPSGLNLQLPMSSALQRAINQPSDSSDPNKYQ